MVEISENLVHTKYIVSLELEKSNFTKIRVRFWSPNSAFKSAIFSTFKSAFTQKSAFKSANKSANNSNFLLKVPIIVLLKVPIIVTPYKKCQK